MASKTDNKRIYRVKNTSQSPPGGWHWKDPVTRQILSDDTLSGLEGAVTIHLIDSGRDVGNVEAEIHHTTAASLLAKHRDLVDIFFEKPRTVSQYFSGASAIALKWWMESPIYGTIKGENEREGVYVDQEEANRRAAICCGPKGGKNPCEENAIPISKEWLQAWTDGEMLGCVDGKETDRHSELGACAACTCELRAAIWWSPKIIKASMLVTDYEKQLPDHCWKKNLDNLNNTK